MQPPTTAQPRRQCEHCGTPFAPRQPQERFCCSGCEAVSAMIRAQGLGHFYDLRQGISTPVGERDSQKHDFGWLQTLASQAEADARDSDRANATLALPLSGVHCAGCRWLIAQLFARQHGAESCALDAEGLFIRFDWRLSDLDASPRFDATAFARLLLAFGYTLENPAQPRNANTTGSHTPTGGHPGSANSPARKRLTPHLLLCGVFTLNAIIFALPARLGASVEVFPFQRLFGLLVLLCATLATGLAASYFWQAPRFGPRRLLALALILLCLLALAGPSLSLPAIFAADAAAAVSFIALLIASVAEMTGAPFSKRANS